MLLNLARDLFEDTTNLDLMMKKVMIESMELIPSEKCSVMLIDQDRSEVYIHIKVVYSNVIVLIVTYSHKCANCFRLINVLMRCSCHLQYIHRRKPVMPL